MTRTKRTRPELATSKKEAPNPDPRQHILALLIYVAFYCCFRFLQVLFYIMRCEIWPCVEVTSLDSLDECVFEGGERHCM
jgi:hypothetical protein